MTDLTPAERIEIRKYAESMPEELVVSLKPSTVLLMLDELDEHDARFELQWKRMGEATKMWQDAHDIHDEWPDLGDLLTWLMAEIKYAKEAQK